MLIWSGADLQRRAGAKAALPCTQTVFTLHLPHTLCSVMNKVTSVSDMSLESHTTIGVNLDVSRKEPEEDATRHRKALHKLLEI